MKKNKMKMLAFLLVLCLTSCGSGKENAEHKVTLDDPVMVKMDTAAAAYQDLCVQTIYDAKVTPRTENIYFSEAGAFGNFLVGVGEKVIKGQEIANLSSEYQESQYEQMQAQYDRTKLNYENEQAQLKSQIEEANVVKANDSTQTQKMDLQIKLYQEQLSLSKELMDCDLDDIKRNMERLTNTLNHSTITAPFDGTIAALAKLSYGNGVGPDTVIAVIADDSKACITSDYIKEIDIRSCDSYTAFVNGKQYEVTYEPLDKDSIKVMTAKGIEIKSTFGFSKESKVDFGQAAVICLTTLSKEHVLSIPNAAVYKDSLGKYVYVLEDSVRTRHNIITGDSDLNYTEVLDGLKEGDEVYVKD